jgi:hypothetical protein
MPYRCRLAVFRGLPAGPPSDIDELFRLTLTKLTDQKLNVVESMYVRGAPNERP